MDLSFGSLPGKEHRKLLRIFALAAVFAVALILALAGVGLNALVRMHLLEEVRDDALHLSHVLLQHGLETYLKPEGEVPRDIPPEMAGALNARLANFHVLRIKIFGPDKRIVFSNEPKLTGTIDWRNEHLDRVLKGETFTEMKVQGSATDLESEELFDRDVVETYLPIRDNAGRVVGAFGIYTDVHRYRREQKQIVVGALGILSVVLILVFGLLFLIMRRATRLLYARTREVKILSGLLPICSCCKKIRNDTQEWETLESYISSRSESSFTHSLCPDCLEHYGTGDG